MPRLDDPEPGCRSSDIVFAVAAAAAFGEAVAAILDGRQTFAEEQFFELLRFLGLTVSRTSWRITGSRLAASMP